MSLLSLPSELLERVAFISGTENVLGPPRSLVALASLNKEISSVLGRPSNHHLYAKIFAQKFDLSPIISRLGADRVSSECISDELVHRFTILKRIRSMSDALAGPEEIHDGSKERREVLIHAYILMLENEGLNEKQLRIYANMDEWLESYWVKEHGGSFAQYLLGKNFWLRNDEESALAMWLFWFLLNPVHHRFRSFQSNETMGKVLKLYALASHRFPLVEQPWLHYILDTDVSSRKHNVTYFGETFPFKIPPPAIPAILSFMDHVTGSVPLGNSKINPSTPEFGVEWSRCLSIGSGERCTNLNGTFRPGSMQGVWEGMFMFSDFSAFSALLAGAPPSTVQEAQAVRHKQTWIIREHHMLASPNSLEGYDSSSQQPLPGGDAIGSYFPTGTRIKETPTGLEVRYPGSAEPLLYTAPVEEAPTVAEDCSPNLNGTPNQVLDVIVIGESHSAWGESSLIGRVRPCDGFISITKEYINGERGKWLYRGYLVGDSNGHFGGRWRDTVSPAAVPGYEGCFSMRRRR